ncbi:ABC transporter permease subunit [Clostridium sp. Sa3CUN1]|uniref:ABC transporter permease subunit n=1 Tax=Clostridium gallinarum TaxID=2762246 RepID=A0ABR8Q712_9CLOT|nr:ABC transporter permease subunit [Clostridium gallinarum]MBD7916219.1 ABC transporter permease subunit [Clostridium gallinarum]
MIPLIKLEFKKFFKKPKNVVLIILLFVIISIFINLNINLDKNILRNTKLSIDAEIDSLNSALINIENELIKLPDNDKLKNIKNIYKENLYLLETQKSAYEKNDSIQILECQIKLDKNLLIEINNGSVITPKSVEYLNDNISINSILLEKGIRPINENSTMESFNFLKLFLNSPFSLLIIISLIIFSSDIISSESENKTFNLLLTQPISKNKILISKTLSIILINTLLLLSILLINFLFIGFTQGFGDVNYPTRYFINGIIQYIPIWKFTIYLIILFVLLIIFISILSIFTSSISKQSSTSFSIIIILTTTFYLIINNGFFKGISHLIPFTYINLSSALQGYLAINTNNVNINLFNSIIILVIYSLLIFLLNIFIFNKRSNY